MRIFGTMLIIWMILGTDLLSLISCQMFDKNPTIYDHMKSGAYTKQSNLIDSELKVESEFKPESCKIDDDNFYGDRDDEIKRAKENLRFITAEYGDTLTLHFKIMLEKDGTVIDESKQPAATLGAEDIETPAVFTLGYGMVIAGWDIGSEGMCIGEKRRITIPPQLAYGSKGYKKKNIPPDVTLIIEAELISLKKKDAGDYFIDFLRSLHVYTFFILGLTFLLSGCYKAQIANKRRLYREIQQKNMESESELEQEDHEECDEYKTEENVKEKTE